VVHFGAKIIGIPILKMLYTNTREGYCTTLTVSSVTHNGQKKSPCFKSLEFKRKFISHLGQQIFRIHKLRVEMVQHDETLMLGKIEYQRVTKMTKKAIETGCNNETASLS
jgi:hypothetical protein